MPTRKLIHVDVKTFKDYFRILNGLMQLTETELTVLEAFITLHFNIQKKGLNATAFDTDMKKRVAEALGRDDPNTLNGYIKKLKDKGAIVPNGETYDFAPIVMPRKEDQIVINIKYL